MRKKLIYGCLLLLTFSNCKKTEETNMPLHPSLRTDGLYIAYDYDCYAFRKNKEGKNERDDCYSVLRFYKSGKGFVTNQNMQKGNFISNKAITEIYNDPQKYWNYQNLYRATPSMESQMFHPENYNNDSIKFRSYLTTDSKDVWKDFKGIIYKDSLELTFEIHSSPELRAKMKLHDKNYDDKPDNIKSIPKHKLKYRFYPVQTNSN